MVMTRAVCCLVLLVQPLAVHCSRSTISIGSSLKLTLEQEFEGAEEGSVIWDASRGFLAHIVRRQQASDDRVRGARVLELGAGTGVVGIALSRLGAKSVVLTDLPGQLPLISRNLVHNQPECCASRCVLCANVALTEVKVLCWEPGQWRESAPTLAVPDSFDLIVACDCVYPGQSSDHLAAVLLELLELNPSATILLAVERRPPPAEAPPGTDHLGDFLARMRARCDVERVPDDELDPAWNYDELSIWRMRHGTGS